MNQEYHKIDGLFMRQEGTKKLLRGQFRSPVVEYLQNNTWVFTEKIDGTNIRIHWDGHRVSFAGRTDRALIPAELFDRLSVLFSGEANEQMFEQQFGDNEVTLYGEGFGRRIQNGGNYIPDGVDFILFDVMKNGRFLPRYAVNGIAHAFGIRSVPIVLTGTIHDAIRLVESKPKSTIGTAPMEGVVGVPACDLTTSRGERIIVKIKVRDFNELERQDKV